MDSREYGFLMSHAYASEHDAVNAMKYGRVKWRYSLLPKDEVAEATASNNPPDTQAEA